MSKKTAGDSSVADQIAVFIGKSMGELMNRKSALQDQLADVEKQIEGVRKSVMKQFGGTVTLLPDEWVKKLEPIKECL